MKQLIFITSCCAMLFLGGCTGTTGGDNSTSTSNSISWSAPTTRVDGTAMSRNEISGYRISYGIAPGNLEYVENLSATASSWTISNVAPGTWYFWLQTIDSQGRVGPPSAINSIAIR